MRVLVAILASIISAQVLNGPLWAADRSTDAAVLRALEQTRPATWIAATPGKASQPRSSQVRAQVTAQRSADMAAAMDAAIVQLVIQEGQTVEAGTLLIGFDCAVEKAEARRAEVERAAARKQVAVTRKLNKLQGVNAAELARHEADAAIAEADLAIARTQIAKCTVTAPFTGIVANLPVREFGFVRVGDPILRLVDPTSLDVDVIVPSLWLRWLKPGHPGTVTIEELDQSFDITVQRIGAEIDPVSRSVKVIASISDIGTDLKPGMSGSASFEGVPE